MTLFDFPIIFKTLIDLTGKNEHSSYAVNGANYICKTDVFSEDNNFYKRHCLDYTMSKETSLDIDTPEDWAMAKEVYDA